MVSIMLHNKTALRQICLERRAQLSPSEKEHFSSIIFDALNQEISTRYSHPIHILCYRSTSNEVSTTLYFEQPMAHQRYAPQTLEDGNMNWIAVNQDTCWQKGAFGILEPTDGEIWQPADTTTILLSPIVGFDQQCNRIGMGKGFFDRWLATYQQHIDCIIGLAFSCQACETINHEPHDVPLHAIITEKGWIRCPSI